MKISRTCLATFLFLPVLLHAQASPTATASISVDAASSPGPVNRLVFGHNMEAADNARIFSSDSTDVISLQNGGGFWDPVKRAPVPAILARSREVGMPLMRYPGGSLVHNYDWRKAVGPLETRGEWKFGIDEYLAYCKAVGAEPMFTVSDYVLPADQMPANAAGLVEYLNAPATADHPWAMKRKEWGHPEPYGVRWFELGNESDEGNCRVLPHRHFTADEYAAYANATAAAMRAFDPSIKIGIVMMPGPGIDVQCTWNRTVAHLAGKSADYLIVHLYGPDISKSTSTPDYFQGCMAVGEQAEKHLDEYQAMALEECGRALPIAITEYNGPLSPDRAPYRFSYGVALECADLLRIYLQPEHHVLAANYWQFLNGAFGMVRSDRNAPDGGKIEEKPAYALFQLWAGHLGARLVAVHVDGPRATYRGSGSVYPATGDALVPSRQLGKMPIDGRFDFSNLNAGITAKSGTGGAFTLVLAGVTGETYPRLARLPKPGVTGACDYEVTFEARFVPDSGSQTVPVGLGVEDARGWPVTRSAIAINGIGTEWKAFRGQYHALPDTATVEIQARFEFGTTRVSGRLEVRGLQIEASSAPTYPAYSLLTATASTSEDGKTLHLIVFNKSAGQDIPARLNVAGFHPASASVWEVHGLRLEARDGVAETVLGAPLDVAGAEPVHTFPAHSMTAIDFVAAAGQQAK